MIELHHGDCLEIMPLIPDKSIDMILCDLPYGTTACKWDVVIPFVDLWAQYERVIKDNGAIVLTASHPFTSTLIQSNFSLFKYCWYWQKTTPSGFLNAKKQPLRVIEEVLVFYKSQPIYNPILRLLEKKNIRRGRYKANIKNKEVYGAMDDEFIKNSTREIPFENGYPINVISTKSDGNNRTEFRHPTQKPVSLMEYLIKTYTNEGETVLDNCMGSGTTGVACINLNRNFIGIEKDEKYFEITKKRVHENIHAKRGELFI